MVFTLSILNLNNFYEENFMYPMSTKSKVIRISLLPVWLVIWIVGGTTLAFAYIFEGIWNGMDKLRDKFEEWVNNIAPLDKDKKV